ncbi:hypothetical protein ACJX0J_034433, partial [Zea mays]
IKELPGRPRKEEGAKEIGRIGNNIAVLIHPLDDAKISVKDKASVMYAKDKEWWVLIHSTTISGSVVQKHEEISKVEKDSVLRHTEYGRVNTGRRQVPGPFQ